MASDTPIMFFKKSEILLLLLLTITLFKKVYSTLFTLLTTQSDNFTQNRKKPKITYNGLSQELNKGKTKIIQKIA